MTARPDEDRGRALMEEAAPAIREGVERLAVPWVVRETTRLLDAWGRVDDATRARVLAQARDTGADATARVVAKLDDLFATDPAAMRGTPLEIVRTLRYEVTALLADAGVAPVERDIFEERAFPDDVYGVVPHSLAELGDAELGPMLMAWGLGKSMVLRARVDRPGSSDS